MPKMRLITFEKYETSEGTIDAKGIEEFAKTAADIPALDVFFGVVQPNGIPYESTPESDWQLNRNAQRTIAGDFMAMLVESGRPGLEAASLAMKRMSSKALTTWMALSPLSVEKVIGTQLSGTRNSVTLEEVKLAIFDAKWAREKRMADRQAAASAAASAGAASLRENPRAKSAGAVTDEPA